MKKRYSNPTLTPLGSVSRLTAAMLVGSYLDRLGKLPNGNTGVMLMPPMK